MNEVVIKPSLREQFLQGWAQCRVIFFSAPCGFGKSTAATALLGKPACFRQKTRNSCASPCRKM